MNLYGEGAYLSAQITGCSYGQWWYLILPDQTVLSTDGGNSWITVDMGWTLPTTNWFGDQIQNAVCAGTSYLNWMQAQLVNWWKIPVTNSLATTWLWFNANGPSAGLPFRLMFGQPPPSPTKGDPSQLALFQMFSFTYFPYFAGAPVTERPAKWTGADIPGFVCGNPNNYQKVIWNQNFGMTTFMTPVDAKSNPLPTRVLYTWMPDHKYQVLTDRGQNTLMWYIYNPQSGLVWEEALMFGIAPPNVPPPPYSGSSFLIDLHTDGTEACQTMPLGQEPPDWAYVPEVDGTIQACITNNPTLCPGQIVTVTSVLFPPSDEYPQGRYLWTWYALFPGSNGTHSRPITFMESASTIAEGGTSLALADYFDYRELSPEISPNCYVIPGACLQRAAAPLGKE